MLGSVGSRNPQQVSSCVATLDIKTNRPNQDILVPDWLITSRVTKIVLIGCLLVLVWSAPRYQSHHQLNSWCNDMDKLRLIISSPTDSQILPARHPTLAHCRQQMRDRPTMWGVRGRKEFRGPVPAHSPVCTGCG